MTLPPDHARWVVIFSEDSFEYSHGFDSAALAAAFAAGAQEGASYYGSGVNAWVLPDDLGEIQEAIKEGYVPESEWQRISRNVPEWALASPTGDKT